MNRPKRTTMGLGGCLVLVFFAFGVLAIALLSSTYLLWHGVAAQGVIVGEEATICGKSGRGDIFSVQFTDQTGQTPTP